MPKEVKWAISLAVGFGLLAVGWKFYFVLVTLHIVICGLLIVVVMLQSGEAADLAGAFGGAGSQTAFGPRGAATFLSKATTWCAIMFMLTSMALTMHQNTVIGVHRKFRLATILQAVEIERSSGPPPQPGFRRHSGPQLPRRLRQRHRSRILSVVRGLSD